MLDKYVDDVVYVTNTGGPNGEIITIRGKKDLRARFTSAFETFDITIKIQSIRQHGTFVRVRSALFYEHRETGHGLSCSLRQIMRFEGFRIAETHDFQDAAKMASFWNLLGDPLQRLRKPQSA